MKDERAVRQLERQVFDSRHLGLRSVLRFGSYNYAAAHVPLPKHRHRGEVEICFLERGRQTYRVQGREYHLRGGDMFMTQPGEAHDTAGEPEEKGRLYWITLRDPERTDGALLDLPRAQTMALWKALRVAEPRQFRGVAGLKTHLEAIREVAGGEGGALRGVAIRARLLLLLLGVVEARSGAVEINRLGWLQPVLCHVRENIQEPEVVVVDELARVSGLSTAHFKVKFKEFTGVPPAEYVVRERVRVAVAMLASGGRSVTEVAFETGFSSSQYFASTCKRITGRSPSEFVGSR